MYEDTKALLLLRSVHSSIRLRPGLEALLKNWEHDKEPSVLESILIKLGSCDSEYLSFLVITTLDTNSLKKFNESLLWLDGDYDDDNEWINMLFPRQTHITWSKDERRLVDIWHNDFWEYWYN